MLDTSHILSIILIIIFSEVYFILIFWIYFSPQLMSAVMAKEVYMDISFPFPDFASSCIGYPGQQRAKDGEVAKFGRPVSNFCTFDSRIALVDSD